MPTIIIPTDFSPTTAIALRVAANLAEKTGYNLEAVHFHDGYGDSKTFLVREGDLEAQSLAERKLEEFIRFNIAPGTVNPKVMDRLGLRTLKGDPAEGLLNISKAQDTALIVMGASGEGVKNNSSIFYGSVAKAVSMKASCPVLLIPRNAEDRTNFERIAYSFETEVPLQEMFDKVNPIFSKVSNDVLYVHLEDDNPDVEAEEMAFLSQPNSFFASQGGVKIMEPGELVTRLAQFSRSEQLDLLIVGHRQRGAVESFFVRSNAKRLLEVCNIPLLVVPVEKY